MKKEQLEQYASQLEMDVYHISYYLLKAQKMMVLQSLCDFNVWWMADISLLLMPGETIDFLTEHRERFKRRITAKEFIIYDLIIKLKHPENFDEFAGCIKKQNLYERRNPQNKVIAASAMSK